MNEVLQDSAKKLIGKIASIYVGDMAFSVRILDVKSAYGNVRFQVEPVDGSGTAWTQKLRVYKGTKDYGDMAFTGTLNA